MHEATTITSSRSREALLGTLPANPIGQFRPSWLQI
jgi:hypothetical protein